MLKNYFKTIFRNLWKNKAYSFLNIAGLAIGITSAALIGIWVEDETSFNHNFEKHDHLYRVMQNRKNDAGINTSGATPGPLAAALKNDIPGIRNSGRLSWSMDQKVVVGDLSTKEKGIYADPSVLTMCSLKFKYGKADGALKDPNNIVISETLAGKFFGKENPVGKTLKMDANGAYSVDGLYTVTGVFADLPANCSYHFQWVSPYETWENANDWLKPWSNAVIETMVELNDPADAASINRKLIDYLGTKVDGAKNQLFLFSMDDWNLRNHFENGVQTGGTIQYVRLFTLIGIIILLIACINFMNLATARSEQRAKEVGVLKVMGAGKGRLIGKFMGESVIMSLMAVLLAIVLLYLLMPAFNSLVEKQLSLNLFTPSHITALTGIAVLAGLVAGSYPAFFLSSFNPVKVLKGMRIKSNRAVVFIRKGLVIAQFSASVILIIGTVIIYQQVQHIKNRDIGYNKDRLVYMNLQGNMKAHFGVIKNKLIATGYVENAATSLHDALHIHSFGDAWSWQGKNPNLKIPIHSNVVSPGYMSTMHLKLVSGRDFYEGGADTNKVVINESLARLMGNEGKVGSMLKTSRFDLEIVGVVKDFIYNDVYGSSAPLILIGGYYGATVMALRFKPQVDLAQALAKTEAVMKAENPGSPFEYKFADEDFNALFVSETLIGKLAGIFASLAIFISCLGLFGLAAYTAERRTKEIGIRKVLGASVTGVVGLLSKEFVQLVALSCLIAFPVGQWAMHNWLQGYEYRITIHWWVFAFAGVAALAIALITVSFQAIKAAIVNPVKSLKEQ
ncbi:ABC transporter permease [Paraflavitalea soli]|uniref:ABC transporter permease n=1 Tax=Paraflavitalea soli TaxID=2315862 RepID=A0A3B7MJ11_9BACT|nr:ABC transporter permease [Paraflavitalea soli]AXY74188.1 ABC transporter permease [Paraflavitalea soli]